MQQRLSLGQPPELACQRACEAPALGEHVQPIGLYVKFRDGSPLCTALMSICKACREPVLRVRLVCYMCNAVQAMVEDMKHNIEGIEAFAWQPQTPARQRASSLYGACALLSKLSSHSSGSLLREGSQVCTPLRKGWHQSASTLDFVWTMEANISLSVCCPEHVYSLAPESTFSCYAIIESTSAFMCRSSRRHSQRVSCQMSAPPRDHRTRGRPNGCRPYQRWVVHRCRWALSHPLLASCPARCRAPCQQS